MDELPIYLITEYVAKVSIAPTLLKIDVTES